MTDGPSSGKNGGRHLAPCPKTPNCVSSLDARTKYFVDPFVYTGSWMNARNALLTILETFQRSRIVTAEENYIHAEFRSRLFRFTDDVELMADVQEEKIHVRSASRTGYWDLGANRRRVEMIRKAFYQIASEKAKFL